MLHATSSGEDGARWSLDLERGSVVASSDSMGNLRVGSPLILIDVCALCPDLPSRTQGHPRSGRSLLSARRGSGRSLDPKKSRGPGPAKPCNRSFHGDHGVEPVDPLRPYDFIVVGEAD